MHARFSGHARTSASFVANVQFPYRFVFLAAVHSLLPPYPVMRYRAPRLVAIRCDWTLPTSFRSAARADHGTHCSACSLTAALVVGTPFVQTRFCGYSHCTSDVIRGAVHVPHRFVCCAEFHSCGAIATIRCRLTSVTPRGFGEDHSPIRVFRWPPVVR